jgi:hypothetical protein
VTEWIPIVNSTRAGVDFPVEVPSTKVSAPLGLLFT